MAGGLPVVEGDLRRGIDLATLLVEPSAILESAVFADLRSEEKLVAARDVLDPAGADAFEAGDRVGEAFTDTFVHWTLYRWSEKRPRPMRGRASLPHLPWERSLGLAARFDADMIAAFKAIVDLLKGFFHFIPVCRPGIAEIRIVHVILSGGREATGRGRGSSRCRGRPSTWN